MSITNVPYYWKLDIQVRFANGGIWGVNDLANSGACYVKALLKQIRKSKRPWKQRTAKQHAQDIEWYAAAKRRDDNRYRAITDYYDKVDGLPAHALTVTSGTFHRPNTTDEIDQLIIKGNQSLTDFRDSVDLHYLGKNYRQKINRRMKILYRAHEFGKKKSKLHTHLAFIPPKVGNNYVDVESIKRQLPILWKMICPNGECTEGGKKWIKKAGKFITIPGPMTTFDYIRWCRYSYTRATL